MKKIILLSALFLTTVCQSNATPKAIRKQSNQDIQNNSVADLITPRSLSCGFNEKYDELIFDYFAYANQTPLTNYNPSRKILTLSTGDTITGVKLFSKDREKTKHVIATKAHIDVDVHKYGVQVLRISQFSTDGLEYSEYESSGYYLILKGLPTANKAKLAIKGVYLESGGILEGTNGGNTRMICVMAG